MTYLKMQQSGPARTPFAQNRNRADEKIGHYCSLIVFYVDFTLFNSSTIRKNYSLNNHGNVYK